jgi:hypothetical protein
MVSVMAQIAEATAQTATNDILADHSDDRASLLLRRQREQVAAIHDDYEAWVIERLHCSTLDYALDPTAPRRWAANEEAAIDLLRRLAQYHGW